MKHEFLSLQQVELRKLKEGEFFTLNEPNDANDMPEQSVWVRGCYERTDRKYYCYKYADMNHERPMKGTRKVWVGFTF